MFIRYSNCIYNKHMSLDIFSNSIEIINLYLTKVQPNLYSEFVFNIFYYYKHT